MTINDKKYLKLVNDILENNKFNELDTIEHHGMTRLDHSIRVSYYSYKISKILGLDYVTTARAGLLHDFFISKENRTLKERFISTFVHPKYAVMNAEKYFDIDDKAKNIIESHMFPIYKVLPKYAESWIVSGVDKIAALYEFSKAFGIRFSYAANIFVLLILNNLK